MPTATIQAVGDDGKQHTVTVWYRSHNVANAEDDRQTMVDIDRVNFEDRPMTQLDEKRIRRTSHRCATRDLSGSSM